MKVVEIKEQITEKRNRIQEIIDLCKAEIRDMSEEEEKEVEELKAQIDEKKDEICKLQRELDEKLPKEDTEEDRNITNKSNIRKMKTQNQSLVKEIREALAENKKSFTMEMESRTVTVTGGEGVHDQVVETEIQGIWSGLYANSVLSKLGVRMYSGLPMGDIQIPKMSKQSVGWEDEIDEAQATGVSFTTVKLSPHRLTAYVDISKQLLAQDTIGVEAAIRADIVNALNDKLEATIFGNAAGTTAKPAGLFYNISETNVDDYAGLCQFEAAVEEENVFGNMKYVMNPKAKATFRSMVKGENANRGFVYEGGEMDGIECLVTTNVASKKFIYGDFSNLAVGVWNNLEITLDPYTVATKGCIRLIINGYFDAKKVREEAFNYGNVD